MKKLFWGISCFLLIIILFLGSFLGSYFVFAKQETRIDSTYLYKFSDSDSEYYLQNASPTMEIFIDSDSDDYYNLFEMYDYNDEVIKNPVSKVSSSQFKIMPPSGGYTAGRTYTIKLKEGAAFSGADLEKARVLTFSIDKEFIEHYTFTDNLKHIDQDNINIVNEDVISLTGHDVSVGDIIMSEAEGNQFMAYKVKEIIEDGMVSVDTPGLEEIYSDLEVYGEYTLDIDDIIANPELEIEIANNIRNSDFLSSLIQTAYAEEDTPELPEIKVKLKPHGKGSAIIDIEIALKPGKTGLFGKQKLKNHEVIIKLKTVFSIKLKSNISINPKFYLDISGQLIMDDHTWSVEINPIYRERKTDKSIEDIFSDKNTKDYNKNVKEITEALNEIEADKTEGDLKLFDINLPIPSVPGLSFSLEVKLFAKLETAAGIAIGENTKKLDMTVGVCFSNGKFRSYSNQNIEDRDSSLALKGKAKFKSGLKFGVKATILNEKIALIKINPQMGLYADLFVTIPVNGFDDITEKEFLYSYFETGTFFSASITTRIRLFMQSYNLDIQLAERKAPVIKMGNNKIAIGILPNPQTVKTHNNIAAAPEIIFEYYNVKNSRIESEILSLSDVEFFLDDNTKIEVNDGILDIPVTTGNNSYNVTAVYKHKGDKRKYNTTFIITFDEPSIIDGTPSEPPVEEPTDDPIDEPIDEPIEEPTPTNPPEIPRTSADAAGDCIGLSVRNVTQLIGTNYEVVNSWNSTGLYYEDIQWFLLLGELYPEGYEPTGEEIIKFIEVFNGEVVPGANIGDSAEKIANALNITDHTLEYSDYAEAEGLFPYILFHEMKINGYNCAITFYFESEYGDECKYAFIKSHELYR